MFSYDADDDEPCEFVTPASFEKEAELETRIGKLHPKEADRVREYTNPYLGKGREQSLAQRLAQGREQGLAQRLTAGLMKLLLRLSRKRFGQVPDKVRGKMISLCLMIGLMRSERPYLIGEAILDTNRLEDSKSF